jgi:hypothetical protein
MNETTISPVPPSRYENRSAPPPYIYAEQSTFNGLLIDEQPSSDVRKQFQQIAPSTEAQRHRGADRLTNPVSINLTTQENPGQVFVNATIQAHYQAVNEIHIPGITLVVEYDANGDGDYTDEGDVTLGG